MAAGSQEMDEFLDSTKKCFNDMNQALADENASIPFVYLQSRLEDLIPCTYREQPSSGCGDC